MEPPPPISTTGNYAESLDSSPRSRATDIDDPFPATSSPKLRLMCSYGGHIVPRPHDKSLCYVGGDTRMVVVDRSSTLPDLTSRLSKTLLNGRNFTLKYQLPNEDLDSLITVSSEEDLDNMIDEYDRLTGGGGGGGGKSSRIRLFLFPTKPEGATSIGSILDGSNRSEDWFLNALNGAAELQRGFSDPSGVNCLLGLDESGTFGNPDLNLNHANSTDAGTASGNSKEMDKLGKFGGNSNTQINNNHNNNNQSNPDVQSVPDSPIIETTSSFGSTSSSPSLANLPPIRVHVEEGSVGGGAGAGIRVMEQRMGGGGIEEQFAQMGISVQRQQIDDQGYLVVSSPSTGVPASMMTGIPASGGAVVGAGGGEFANRVFSDDERSDHGGRKQQQQQQQMGQPMMVITSQPQQKHVSGGGSDLPSPDSVSSDSSFSNVLSRQKPVIYQDPNVQLSSGSGRLQSNMVDPNNRIPMQQVSESGYVIHPQYEQHQQQMLQHQQQQQQLLQQQHQQQQQQQQQHQQQQQQHQQQQQQHQHQHQHQHQQQQGQPQAQGPPQAQQYISAGTHFVHHPSHGAMPMQAYYSIYPPQQSQHHPHQYPVYYVPAGQAPQGYSLPVQQQQPPNLGELATSNPSTRPQTPPNPTIIPTSSAYNPNRNVAPPKPELIPGVYQTATSAGPQLVQVPPNQHQPPQSQGPPQSQSQLQHQPQQQQQFMGYSQIHHPPQSIAPGSAAGAGSYAYEFADPARSQIYFTQPLAPSLAAQYQGMASGPAMVLTDGSSQIPNETVKQQIRSSQPL